MAVLACLPLRVDHDLCDFVQSCKKYRAIRSLASTFASARLGHHAIQIDTWIETAAEDPKEGWTEMTDEKPTHHWYRLTPDRCVIGLLVVEGLLWLSERFQWFAFNEKKGWTVLIDTAARASSIDLPSIILREGGAQAGGLLGNGRSLGLIHLSHLQFRAGVCKKKCVDH